MIQSGNFVVPTFNHVPRYDKPPLIYWCQAVAYKIFGENALSARLPSLLATAATAVLLYTWGIRLGGEQVGIGAGLCYAFCLQTIQQGRVATADALLIFFMTLTAFAGWLILRPRTSDHVPLPCYTVLALGFAGGFLAKGPEVLLPFLPLIWLARSAGRSTITGLIVSLVAGLALVLLWAIPAYLQTNGDYWYRGLKAGIGDRAVAGLQGHGASTVGWYLVTLPYYLVIFWISALPWSPLILIRAKKLFAAWQPDRADTYLLANVAIVFLVFTLMVTKLPHYTLPAFPLIALLLARRWNASGLSVSLPIRLAGGFGLGVALLTLVAVPLALANHATPSPVGELVRAAGDSLKPETEFALVDFQEPNTIWEMRRVCQGYGQPIAEVNMDTFLNQPGPRAAVLSTDLLHHLRARRNISQPDWKYFDARGINAAKGNFIDLTLVVKP